MKTITLATAFSVTILFGISASQAQLIQQGPNGWTLNGTTQTMPAQQVMPVQQQVIPNQFPQNGVPQTTYPIQPQYQQVQPQVQPVQPTPGQSVVNHGYIPNQYNSYPYQVTADQVVGRNRYGGIHTRNEQVNNTYFDPNRESSKNNGTYRFVQRNVYDVNGRVVGREEGYVWNNSVTGQEHGELRTITHKNPQDTHEQFRVQSPPVNTHEQIRMQSAPINTHEQVRMQSAPINTHEQIRMQSVPGGQN